MKRTLLNLAAVVAMCLALGLCAFTYRYLQREPVPAQAESAPALSAEPEASPAEPAPDETALPVTVPDEAAPAETALPETAPENGKVVVLDPGHQSRANLTQEPVGPGAAETKYAVSGGTQGVVTGEPEHALNLTVALALREELELRGYTVLLVRESGDVDISNAQRAALANRWGADAFLRLHANGSENSAAQGIMTICQTAHNPYNAHLYPQCRRLADCLLTALLAATGAQSDGVWETDTMSGINWCQVPVAIVEMGYMSNPEEDRRLASPEYQEKLVQGLANGVAAYLGQ